jgi:tape measure domain-containing protein
MAKEEVTIVYRLKDLTKQGVSKIQKGLHNVGQTIDKVRSSIISFTKHVTILSAIVGGLATVFLRAAGSFEQWQVSFETMLGSATKAEKLLEDIKKFAAKTPFQLTGLIESSKKLLAFGIASENIINTLRRLGDVAAGIGPQKLSSLILAFGKIRTKGVATMEELNIMLEAGVPILDELAKNLNVSKREIVDMVSKGKIGFADIDKVFTTLTTGSGKFANLMSRQSKTFFGVISNIKDNLTQVAIAIGQDLLPKAKKLGEAIKNFTDLDSGKLLIFLREIEIFFLKLITSARINHLILIELIARPFKFETYRPIITQSIKQFKNLFFNPLKRLAQGLNIIRKKQEEKRLGDTRTLSEKILDIEKKLQERIVAIRTGAAGGELGSTALVSSDPITEQIVKPEEKKLEKPAEASKETIDETLTETETKIEKAGEVFKGAFAEQIVEGNNAVAESFDSLTKQITENFIKKGLDVAIGKLGELFGGGGGAGGFLGGFLGGPVGGILGGFLPFNQGGIVPGQAFANGGIVDGSSFTGDKQLIRANSSEMYLPRESQKRLLDLAEGRTTGLEKQAADENINITLNLDSTVLTKIVTNKQKILEKNGVIKR